MPKAAAKKPAAKKPARKPGRKLKVFQAQIGFHDMIVAVAGKAAALRAWDVKQDLFAEGLAAPVTDAKALDAALAHPGIPLSRPAGTGKPFALKPGRLPAPPKQKAPKQKAPTQKAPTQKAPKQKAPKQKAPRQEASVKAPPRQAAARKAAAKKAARKSAPKPAPKPADRSALDAAEAALEKLARRQERQEADFVAQQDELRRQRSAARAAHNADVKAATAALAKARRAFRAAGGAVD